MRIKTASVCLAALFSFLLVNDLSAATVSGKVQVAGGKALKNIIIYLESAGDTSPVGFADKNVSQSGRKFAPDRVVIVKGAKITFINNEEKEIDHNVFSLSEARKFDIGLSQRGSEKEVEFSNAGQVKYYCSVHKNMEGVATVVPSPFFMHLDQAGDFKIENVPAGDWLVKAFVSHRRYVGEPVAISLSDAPLQGLVVNVVKKKKKKKKSD